MKRTTLLLFIFSVVTLLSQAKTYPAPAGGKAISRELWGIFFEDINYAGDGGLYAEMVQNHSFEYSLAEHEGWGPTTAWRFVKPGHSTGDVTVNMDRPLHPNNPHYVTLEAEVVGLFRGDSPLHGVGLQNAGFDGMSLKAGERYNVSLWARGRMPLVVALLDGKGKPLGSDTIRVDNDGWQQYTTHFTCDTTVTDGQLAVLAVERGRVDLDMISLFPQHTYKERPNGLRADMMEALRSLHPRFMRFPGGCLVHGPGLKHMYNWKNGIGPVETRKSQPNCWEYHNTMGLGYYEYFLMCEDLRCKPVPVIHAGVTCQGDAKGWNIPGTGQHSLTEAEMRVYVQDILDMIEWATGSADSRWGRLRAEAGHPEPFQLEYIAIGNEENVTDSLVRNLTMLYQAIHSRYPAITVIGTCGYTANGKSHDRGWALARELGMKVVDEHYFQRPDWFIKNQHRYDSYDRTGPQVYFGEYATKDCRLINALAEAVYMTGLERNGDIVRMASYAPLFGKRDHCQWNPNLIYFDNERLCPTPSYYVQQLFSTHAGDYYYGDVIQVKGDVPTLGRSCVFDSQSGDVILKLANADSVTVQVRADLSRFKHMGKTAQVITLTGTPDAQNTFDDARIRPQESTMKVTRSLSIEVPPHTLQVIRITHKAVSH